MPSITKNKGDGTLHAGTPSFVSGEPNYGARRAPHENRAGSRLLSWSRGGFGLGGHDFAVRIATWGCLCRCPVCHMDRDVLCKGRLSASCTNWHIPFWSVVADGALPIG